MAESKRKKSGLQADPEVSIPRIALAEQGFIGLKASNNRILEEANRVFQYPQFLKTIAEMKINPTVASALLVYRMLISRVQWKVEAPLGSSDKLLARTDFVRQCMSDMEHSWSSFISEVLTYLEYGFSIQEKVFYRRLTRNGSKYNDGLVGIRKLAPRGQDTIEEWMFSDDGRELLAVGQTIANLQNSYRYAKLKNARGFIEIPRKNFLLFTADATKGNPQGNSILKPIYLAYKRLELLQDQESVAIAKDLNGIPVFGIPVKFLDPNASAEDKAVGEGIKKLVQNISSGEQRGVVYPLIYDPETKHKMFDLEILANKSVSTYDLDSIIKRYQGDILSALSVDIIKMGQEKGGSYALSDSKTNLLSMALSHRLNEIASVLNNDLIPDLFSRNGWSLDELPKFVPGDIEETSMEEFSKYCQRMGAIGLLEVDREVMNRVREVGGFTLKPIDEEVDYENTTTALSGKTSRSGDGMGVGKSGNGTSDINGDASEEDASVSNSENAA